MGSSASDLWRQSQHEEWWRGRPLFGSAKFRPRSGGDVCLPVALIIDQDNPSAGPESRRECGEVGNPIFQVVIHLAEHDQIDRARLETRLVGGNDARLDVGRVFLLSSGREDVEI